MMCNMLFFFYLYEKTELQTKIRFSHISKIFIYN